jgi:hypothetical protein
MSNPILRIAELKLSEARVRESLLREMLGRMEAANINVPGAFSAESISAAKSDIEIAHDDVEIAEQELLKVR